MKLYLFDYLFITRTINVSLFFRSQIGSGRTEESLKKQEELQKAIDEMKIFTAQCSTPTLTSPTEKDARYSFPLSRPSLLDLMKNVQEEKKSNSE